MTALPTASTLESSSDAFKHPLPIVKQLHKQLEQALEEKNARLRTLVGGSYRQLLGTAETIVTMRRDINDIERRLERVVDGCGKDIMSRKAAGLSVSQSVSVEELSPTHENTMEDYTFLAQTKFFDRCTLAVPRLLRRHAAQEATLQTNVGERLVCASKLVVLSRLVVKDASACRSHGSNAWSTEARKTLSKMRRRLLRTIERSLELSNEDGSNLIYIMCAYCLATSSSLKDAARYFLHVRGDAIAKSFDFEDDHDHKCNSSNNVEHALSIYTRTLLDFRNLAPRRLAEMLKSFKAKPLMQGADVRAQETLRLSMAENWLSEDLVAFVPYIQHEDLNDEQASSMLNSWSAKASQVLLQGFDSAFSLVTDFNELVTQRNTVLGLWIRDGVRAKSYDSASFLTELRQMLNNRLMTVMDSRIAKLHLVATEVEAILATWPLTQAEHRNELWSHNTHDLDMTYGGLNFRNSVIDRANGRSDAVKRVVHSYEAWRHFVDEISDKLAELRAMRWIDDLEEFEDESSLHDRQISLSVDDPAMLQKRLERSLKENFYHLHDKLDNLSSIYLEKETSGTISTFICRIIREIRSRLPAGGELQSFGLSLIPQLHRTLAVSISIAPVNRYIRSLKRTRTSVCTILWEGSPALPLQPSSYLFKMLHAITLNMSYAGHDLWIPSGVFVLKSTMTSQILESLQDHEWFNPSKNTLEESEVIGDDPQSAKESPVKDGDDEVASKSSSDSNTDQHSAAGSDFAIQLIFDLLVLEQLLPQERASAGIYNITERIDAYKSIAHLADADVLRLRTNAREYWKRTGLLLGSLA